MSKIAAPAIQKLPEDVVNRIAAGEVVQRPANAVKEMLENSLDAGATSIVVTVKGGGLQLLQIQDNGHGIRKEDLPILCERFTTSKLRKFDDLKTIATFGFRGEALASITHVARVTVTSKTADSPCAYKARYSDGRLVPLSRGEPAAPRPCAGVQGTTILAEDLFYNMEARRRAFKSPSEQHQRILDVVTRYAVHFGDRPISFTCKKAGQPGPDFHAPAGGTRLANIRLGYGAAVAIELLEFSCGANEEQVDLGAETGGEGGLSGLAVSGSDVLAFKATGLVSNANYSAKKPAFVLFINDRLVESAAIRKAVETAYADLLPKGSKPFAYLSIKLPPCHVDVNVHPTKREVHFLHEEELLETLFRALEERLRGANASRTFYAQPTLPGVHFAVQDAPPAAAAATGAAGSGSSSLGGDDGLQANGKSKKGGEAQAVSGESSSSSTGRRKSSGAGSGATAAAGGGPSAAASSFALGMDGEEEFEFDEEAEGEAAEEARRSSSGQSAAAPAGKRATSGAKRGTKRHAPVSRTEGAGASEEAEEPASNGKRKKAYAPQKLVRTDNTSSSIESFFLPLSQSARGGSSSGGGGGSASGGGATSNASSGAGKVTPLSGGAAASPIDLAYGSATSSPADLCACREPAIDDAGDAGEGLDASPDIVEDEDLLPLTQEGSSSGGGVSGGSSGGASKQQPAAPAKPPAAAKKKAKSRAFGFVGRCNCCGKAAAQGAGPTPPTEESQGSLDGVYDSVGANAAADALNGRSFGVAAATQASQQRRQQQHRKPDTFVETKCSYRSIRELLAEMRNNTHRGLLQMLRKLTFVGMVDMHLSLIQFGTKLILVDHLKLSKEAFYQMAVRRFQVMRPLLLSEPAPIRELVRAALDLPESRWTPDDGPKDDFAEEVACLLEEKAPMLSEYFAITIDQQRRITSLPELFEGHAPLPEELPLFLFRLATRVDWSEEQPCFRGVAMELAEYYSALPEDVEGGGDLLNPTTLAKPMLTEEATKPGAAPPAPAAATPGTKATAAPAAAAAGPTGPKETEDAGAATAGGGAAAAALGAPPAGKAACSNVLVSQATSAHVQHIVYPALRWGLMPPKGLATDGTFVQLACLEKLYRVFERC